MDIFTFILEIIGTVAFASSGAMLAIEKKMDIFGVNILGATTAVLLCIPIQKLSILKSKINFMTR